MSSHSEPADTAASGRYTLDVDRLRDLLAERKLAQATAATQMGVNRGHLNDVLHGRRGLGVRLMEGLRRAFPDDYDQLVIWTMTDADAATRTGEAR